MVHFVDKYTFPLQLMMWVGFMFVRGCSKDPLLQRHTGTESNLGPTHAKNGVYLVTSAHEIKLPFFFFIYKEYYH